MASGFSRPRSAGADSTVPLQVDYVRLRFNNHSGLKTQPADRDHRGAAGPHIAKRRQGVLPDEDANDNEQNHRYRPGHDQFRGGGHGRWRTRGHHQSRRQPPDALGRRLHEDGRAARRSGRQAPGRHQSGKHHLLDQALHGAPVHGSERGNEDGSVPGRRRPRTATSASRRSTRNTPRRKSPR